MACASVDSETVRKSIVPICSCEISHFLLRYFIQRVKSFFKIIISRVTIGQDEKLFRLINAI